MGTDHKPVEIYTTTFCPYCVKAKGLFAKKGIQYSEVNVDEDAARQAMVERTGGAKSVPQIFVDGQFLSGGCDGLFEREQKGELDLILGLK
jgi:glutaredoxin 3